MLASSPIDFFCSFLPVRSFFSYWRLKLSVGDHIYGYALQLIPVSTSHRMMLCDNATVSMCASIFRETIHLPEEIYVAAKI